MAGMTGSGVGATGGGNIGIGVGGSKSNKKGAVGGMKKGALTTTFKDHVVKGGMKR